MTGEDREGLRQVYQREEAMASKFIPAKPRIDIYGEDKLFRVCAYCRVSTDNDAQLSSFELQQQHYQQLVGNHPNWDLRHIYADEGISGTSLKNRDDFNAMIAACERGEYDLIVAMECSNVRQLIKTVGSDPYEKIRLLLSFAGDPGDIADPWYTRDFEKAYREIYKGCEGIIRLLKKREKGK